MLYFPQLASGAMTCYPLVRSIARRTVTNRLADGSRMKLDDPDAGRIEWELHYGGLSDSERETLEDFFNRCEGQLKSFTFLDPAGNLLRRSEDPGHSVWLRDPLVQITAAADDGVQFTNTGQTSQGFSQRVPAPGAFRYCLAAELRSSAPAVVSMSLTSGVTGVSREAHVTPHWSLAFCTSEPVDEAEEVTCRVELAAGATVQIRRLRLHAQPMPGEYQKTTASAGVYSATRFIQDRLMFTADGPNNHATVVRLRSRSGA